MKELSIEEKARAYDEAIESGKSLLSDNKIGNAWIYKLLPELKESWGERIRKALINGFNKLDKSAVWYNGITNGQILDWLEKQGEVKESIISQHENKACKENDESLTSEGERIRKELIKLLRNLFNNYSYFIKDPFYTECINWLEKQGGKKLTDKVEPKFKVGDWVVFKDKHESIYQVEKIEDGYYILRHTYGGTFRVCVLHDEDLRLWTIQDAKDGDVLYNKDDFAGNSVFIYKGISNKTHACLYYTRLFKDKDFRIYNDVMWGNGTGVKGGEFYPATKEQCDALMKAMADAGYTFDFEKKELKEVEQKPADTEKGAKGNDREIPNSVWSEEDEARFESCIKVLQTSDGYDTINAKWLKSLKDRVQPQQQEWSKEDDYYYGIIQYILNNECVGRADKENAINWLKSLKDRYTWKPSDEQIKALANALSLAKNCGEESAFDLRTLYEQIKKLTE